MNSIESTKQEQQNTKQYVIKVLDGRYQILSTLGCGRFAKVKKAIDLASEREVAIKILKMPSEELEDKKLMLSNFLKEISILSKCNHPCIVKLLDASFSGMQTNEQIANPKNEEQALSTKEINQKQFDSNHEQINTQSLKQNRTIVKRKENVCYIVMKLARHGELYKIIEYTDRFQDILARSLFSQLIEGLQYLHTMGIVHRDIKPENLLIDIKGRLIIGDFGYAQDSEMNFIQEKQLQQITKGENNIRKVENQSNIGSEEYNAPELFDQGVKHYDGLKADVFSSGVTLFLMLTKCPPFRTAQMKDPYYRRLNSSDKRPFWKIFDGFMLDPQFKDLFEKIMERDPSQRICIEDIQEHQWLKQGEKLSQSQLTKEIDARGRIVQSIIEQDQYMQKEQHKKYPKIIQKEEDEKKMQKEYEAYEKFKNDLKDELDDIKMKMKQSRNKRRQFITKSEEDKRSISSEEMGREKGDTCSKKSEERVSDDEEGYNQQFLRRQTSEQ